MMFWNNYKSLLMRSFCLEPIGLTLMNWPRAYTGFVAVIDFSFCSVLSKNFFPFLSLTLCSPIDVVVSIRTYQKVTTSLRR